MRSDQLDDGREQLVDLAAEAADAPQSPRAEPSAKAMRDAIRMTALGHATWLMSRSPLHKHLFFADAEWLLMPPIVLNQYRMWVVDGMPRGFATWAFVSPEVEARLASGVTRLAPADWKSGEQAWIVDLIAPFGGATELRRAVLHGRLGQRMVKSLRATERGLLEVDVFEPPYEGS